MTRFLLVLGGLLGLSFGVIGEAAESQPGREVVVEVLAHDGQPQAVATVRLAFSIYDDQTGEFTEIDHEASTGADGHATLSLSAAGAYAGVDEGSLLVKRNDGTTLASAYFREPWDAELREDADSNGKPGNAKQPTSLIEFVKSSARHTASVQVRLPETRTMRGQIQDKAGQPKPGFELSIGYERIEQRPVRWHLGDADDATWFTLDGVREEDHAAGPDDDRIVFEAATSTITGDDGRWTAELPAEAFVSSVIVGDTFGISAERFEADELTESERRRVDQYVPATLRIVAEADGPTTPNIDAISERLSMLALPDPIDLDIRVTHDERPVDGVRVDAIMDDSTADSGSVYPAPLGTTDKAGRIAMIVQPTPNGWPKEQFAIRAMPNVDAEGSRPIGSEVMLIRIANGDIEGPITLELRPTRIVELRVLGETGQPLKDETTVTYRPTRTDDDGKLTSQGRAIALSTPAPFAPLDENERWVWKDAPPSALVFEILTPEPGYQVLNVTGVPKAARGSRSAYEVRLQRRGKAVVRSVPVATR